MISFFLQNGDVLFLGRGERNVASVFRNEFPAVLAQSYFTVMRLTDKRILPEYLAAFLNHPATQTKIRQMASQTTIRSVPASEIGQLTINVLPLATQHKIVEIVNLQRVAEDIETQIEKKRQGLIEYKLQLFLTH
ncbi:MAG: restriction endonuclease subunit S [Planctomycetaceae bacterium]|nr:restriction endonuclease subunit S [Planctomycetaceae bacterium]